VAGVFILGAEASGSAAFESGYGIIVSVGEAGSKYKE
jgi:hypothetical protein